MTSRHPTASVNILIHYNSSPWTISLDRSPYFRIDCLSISTPDKRHYARRSGITAGKRMG